MGLKAAYNEGGVKPAPAENNLIQVSKVEFKNDKNQNLICVILGKIVECSDVPDNVDKTARDQFSLHEINGMFFGAENFIGFIHKATDKLLDVDIEFFEDVKNQSTLEKKLTDQLYGASTVPDKTGEFINLKGYKSKAEYKEAAKTAKATDTDAKASAPNADKPADSNDGW